MPHLFLPDLRLRLSGSVQRKMAALRKSSGISRKEIAFKDLPRSVAASVTGLSQAGYT